MFLDYELNQNFKDQAWDSGMYFQSPTLHICTKAHRLPNGLTFMLDSHKHVWFF